MFGVAFYFIKRHIDTIKVDIIISIDFINIMADKFIETITHMKPMRKKKATIDRTQPHLWRSADVDEVWAMINLEKKSTI